MAKRYELSDHEYDLIQDLLPASGRRGGQWKDHRVVLNGIFWMLHTGAQWRELPERYGRWQTVYARFRLWQRDGTLDRMLHRLHLRLDAEGRIDPETWYVDGTTIRAGRSAGGGGKKISRW